MSNNKKKANKNFFKSPFFIFIIASLIATFILNSLLSFATAPLEKEIYYSDFINMIKNDEISSVTISSDKIIIKTKESVEAEQKFN